MMATALQTDRKHMCNIVGRYLDREQLAEARRISEEFEIPF